MSLDVTTQATTIYTDQKPGTSGLRKKVTVFQQPHYLENFVQATFNALRLPGNDGIPAVLVVGGDGRYLCPEASQTIIKMAAANGVKRIWVGQNALLSTPAVSAIIRTREGGFVAKGAFILTASHNPGGPKEDFGIKYNGPNGGPAPEKLTGQIFQETLKLQDYAICSGLPDVDLGRLGKHVFGDVEVEVIDSTKDYVNLLSTVFDFAALKRLVARPDFQFVFDGMNGVGGPYATAVLKEQLGAPDSSLLNCTPKPDFGNEHPDPNLTYAHDLVKKMGLLSDGTVNNALLGEVPAFGAASDGDADRNMILGGRFFVTPSDSVAVLAAQSKAIPFFARVGGVRSVARSMPTSGALDCVAKALNIPVFEVPTGWKFFGNLMDSKDVYGKTDYNPLICGEESFGTGSNHVREKDGIWAVLSWLSVLSHFNPDPSQPLKTVSDIVTEHWKTYGRNYYRRYDYEGVDSGAADQLMAQLRRTVPADVPPLSGSPCALVDDFEYSDPVDGSVTKAQGIRVVYADGSRFVVRLSGTGSAGATIRLYMEQYMPPKRVEELCGQGALPDTAAALAELANIAVTTTKMEALTGRSAPTVIT